MKTVFEVAQTMTALVKIHVGTQDLIIWEAVVEAENIIAGEVAIRKAEVAAEMLVALEAMLNATSTLQLAIEEDEARRMGEAALRKAKGLTP